MTQKTIVVLDDWERNFQKHAQGWTHWHTVNEHANVRVYHQTLCGAELLQALVDADAVVLMRDRTPFMADLIAQLPKLKYVVFTGTRNTQLDFSALQARGIPVGCTAFGPSKENTCEITWALILGALKQLENSAALMRSGQWRDQAGTALMPLLSGERLGLIGLGEIGGRVAQVGLAFGMEVVTWSPNMTPERARAKAAKAVSLEELLATSKVVSLHLVPSATTKHIINAERMRTMRRDAVLVNTSRASLVDVPALLQALKAQPAPPQTGLGYAALDVYDLEPLPATHELRQLSNVLLTPHLGFVCEPVFKNFDCGVAECLAAWVTGVPLVRPAQS